jgi:hypothetical protein
MVVKRYIGILLIAFSHISLNAQNSFFDEIHLMDYQRSFQLKNDSTRIIDNSFMIRSTSAFQNIQNRFSSKSKNILKSLMIGYDFQNNSLLPQGVNDGNMFSAKGWQERYSIGINVQWGLLDINYQPEKISLQNSTQEYYAGNPDDGNFMFKYFGMVANNIDHFRQFGYEKIDTTSFGQSRVGFKTNYISFGYSIENIWWGPGKRNSLIFSNNAGGFRHYYLNSVKPIKTFIGGFEFSAIAGTLDSTKYTDIDQELLNVCKPCKVFKNLDQRKIDAITINWRPRWIPNLYLGYAFSRQYYANTKNEFGKTYSFFSKDRKQQIMGSMMFRFKLPKDHAEFYGELGLPDEAAYPWKFFKDKNPRTGFVIGANKLVLMGKGKSYLNLNIEFTQLQLMNPKNIFNLGYPFAGGRSNSWYLNTNIQQGWSNNGQLLGAAIGPGSNGQSFSLSWHKGYNKVGVFIERVAHNNDFYFSVYYNPFASGLGYGYYNKYWVDINTKFELQLMPIKNVLISAGFANTNAMNYRWIRIEDGSLYDEPSSITDKFNQQFQLSIKYLLNAVIK